MAIDKQAPGDDQANQDDQSDPQKDGSPQLDDINPGEDDPADLAPDEHYASDQEMDLLFKVMGMVFQALSTGFNKIVEGMKSAPSLDKGIGEMAFHLCATVFASAGKSGQVIPMDIFAMQGGAIYQTIDALLDMAETAGLPVNDDTRKNALGFATQEYLNARKEQGNIDPHDFEDHLKDMEDRSGVPAPPMLRGNPVSSAVQSGLQQQGMGGVLGGMQNGA